MLLLNHDLINSCRICRSPNQDGDYECLYQQIKHEELPQLSEAGKLYENLLDISLDSIDYYPQFLCNSCGLQMKLFKKLKDKAIKTLEYLQKLHMKEVETTKGDILNEAFESIEDDYINEGGEGIAKNIEQNDVEEDMQRMFNEVDEIYVGEQPVEFIAKEELLKNDFINQNDEILQTFQQDHNFESLTGLTCLTSSLTQNEMESIKASDKPEKQYDEKRKMQITFDSVDDQNRISEQDVLEEYANSQTEEILQTFKEDNIFQSLPSLTREEVEKINASDEQYKGNQEMQTIFNNVEQPNVVQQEVNGISEVRVLEEYANSQTEEILQTFQEEENFQSLSFENQMKSQQSSNINYENPYNEDETLLNDDAISTSELFRIKFDSPNTCSVLDKSDYVTEIYELMEDDSKTIQYSETSEHFQDVEDCIDSKAESSIAFSDIEYIESTYLESNEDDVYDEVNELNPPKKRKMNTKKLNAIFKSKEFQCEPCQQEFETSKEYKAHRSLVHNDCYPCNICSKLLKTQKSLYAHMKIHNSQPFQCEICQKTFNQKVHYQYHMNRHNNVRNFKCEECDKAFITKTDLKVHMRFHTGQRSYICDICGKSYLMMEHLKAHSITHTQQKFPCELCQQKFATHKTLKQHMKTIHIEEPKFKCDVCLKLFRRKHHLEYHSTLHQKSINLLDTHYELVEEEETAKDTEYVKDDFINQVDFIDDPGYVALNDEVILM